MPLTHDPTVAGRRWRRGWIMVGIFLPLVALCVWAVVVQLKGENDDVTVLISPMKSTAPLKHEQALAKAVARIQPISLPAALRSVQTPSASMLPGPALIIHRPAAADLPLIAISSPQRSPPGLPALVVPPGAALVAPVPPAPAEDVPSVPPVIGVPALPAPPLNAPTPVLPSAAAVALPAPIPTNVTLPAASNTARPQQAANVAPAADPLVHYPPPNVLAVAAPSAAGSVILPAPSPIGIALPALSTAAKPQADNLNDSSSPDKPSELELAFHPSLQLKGLPSLIGIDGDLPYGKASNDPFKESLRLEEARRFVMSLCQDQQGCLWVGCEEDTPGTGGVQRFDPSAPKLHQWTQFTTKDGLGDNNGYAVACDRKGRIWVGHLNHGVSVYNGRKWQNYEVVGGLSRPDTLSGPLGERVFAIKVCPTDGDVWISTNCGLSRYSESKDDWTYFTRAEGLPSDQSNAIAFDKGGNIYVGTQCDGIAMADAADNYKTWRVATGPDELPLVPAGSGLPTNLINDVLVARDGTVYAATDAGLAWSEDRGHSWQFLRGADWADKVSGLLGGPPEGWKPIAHQTLAEDYSTCLAEAPDGKVWVGHRLRPCDSIGDARLAGQPSAPPSFVQASLYSNGHLVFGCYGGGIMCSALNTVARRPPHISMASDGRQVTVHAESRASATVEAPTFPAGADALSAGALDALGRSLLAELHPRATGTSDTKLAEASNDDWSTGGDWVGRYGREFAVLCAANSPGDHTIALDGIHYSVAAALGPGRRSGDRLRAWVGEVEATEGRYPYDPVIGYRRDASWDDHGEDYGPTWDGLGVGVTVTVPSGSQEVSLYFCNDDGHVGMNRCRDYLVKIFGPLVPGANTARRAELGRCRVQHFFGGVFKSFIVRGPGDYRFSIKRNYSLNTKVAAVMIDEVGGQRPFPEQSDRFGLPLMGATIYVPPAEDLVVDNRGLLATHLWQIASALVTQMHGADSQRATMIQAYRALPQAIAYNTRSAWRWRLRLWSADDRRGFTAAMSTAWKAYSALNPQLLSCRNRGN